MIFIVLGVVLLLLIIKFLYFIIQGDEPKEAVKKAFTDWID